MTWIDCPYCGEKMESIRHECSEGKAAQAGLKLSERIRIAFGGYGANTSLADEVAKLEAENERLRFRECPVCGRTIVVLREIAAHMTGGEPCPGSCSLVSAFEAEQGAISVVANKGTEESETQII